MVLKRILLGAACLMASGIATAENARGELDMPLLHEIRGSICAGSTEIVFVPVSHDYDAYRTSYAVISMNDPDPDTASIVSEREKLWLAANGCNSEPLGALLASDQSDSGGFNF